MKILSAVAVGLLTVGLLAGVSFALAHGGINSGEGNSSILSESLLPEGAELEIKDGGDVEIKDGVVVSVGTDSFDVVLLGITFEVLVSLETEFDGDLMFSDLMAGDIVGIKGMLDSSDHHVINADEVEIVGIDSLFFDAP